MQQYFPQGYNETVRASLLVALVYQASGYLVTRARKRFFNKEFLNKHYGEEHKKYFGTEPPAGGYPDPGDGRYADKLSLGEWNDFNLSVRAFNNFSEWIVASLTTVLLLGLIYPSLGTYLGYILAFGRASYSIGYLYDPSKRMLGAAVSEIAIILGWLAIFYGLYEKRSA